MGKFLFSLFLIISGLAMGQMIKSLVEKGIIGSKVPIDKYIKGAQNIALLIINPIITIGAFWVAKIEDIKLIIIPVLGLSAFVLGGILGLIAAKVMKLDRKQTGSLYVTSSFTNIGSFGGLICYMFFGEVSFAFVSMYKLLEELYYYTVGFSIAKSYGNDDTDGVKPSLTSLLLDPYIIVAFSSILIGFSLNLTGLNRPLGYSSINSMLIPLSSLLLVTSVGFRMKVTAVGKYIKECLAVSAIKFIIIPIVITSAAYLLGLGELSDGLVIKVILVLSAMPPAFTSLIPTQLYNLDIDLANSCWLFNTGALVVVIPLLYFIQNLI